MAVSELGSRLTWRLRYRTNPKISAAMTRTAMIAMAIQRPWDTRPLFQGLPSGRRSPGKPASGCRR